MAKHQADITIVGGGIAGRITALTLAQAGWSVLLVAPGAPVTAATHQGADLRSTAYLQPSQALLQDCGIWPKAAADATPLDALRIVDARGTPPQIATDRTFLASDLSDAPFAWNVLNVDMHRALVRMLDATPRICQIDTSFQSMVTRDADVRLRLANGDTATTRLILGADGRNSAVRKAAGIAANLQRSGQIALAFVASHPVPHDRTSIEIYHEGGPCTLVPMADQNGAPASAVVWMMPGPLAAARATLPAKDLGPILTERTCDLLGPLRPESTVNQWPIQTLRAHALTAQRCAILAEAAHVMPPIGAQGLNTSLQDIAALRDALKDATDPGDPLVLNRYARARKSDTAARSAAVDLLNAVTRSADPAVQTLRGKGLTLAHDIKPIRTALMRAGLGA